MVKICVFIISPYVIRVRVKKENLNIIAVTMIEPATEWYK